VRDRFASELELITDKYDRVSARFEANVRKLLALKEGQVAEDKGILEF